MPIKTIIRTLLLHLFFFHHTIQNMTQTHHIYSHTKLMQTVTVAVSYSLITSLMMIRNDDFFGWER